MASKTSINADTSTLRAITPTRHIINLVVMNFLHSFRLWYVFRIGLVFVMSNGVNNIWILKNSTSLLSSLDQLDVRTATSVQTFDFSTLYTSIPHDVLKYRISSLVHNASRKKDWSVRYTHIKVRRAKGYFTHDINGGGDNMYTADNICKMI